MRTRILVELVIDDDDDRADDAVEAVLDNGAFQEAIEEWAEDNDTPCEVVSALVTKSECVDSEDEGDEEGGDDEG